MQFLSQHVHGQHFNLHGCICVGNAIQAFGNGTDVGVWQPQPPIQPTVHSSTPQRGQERTINGLDDPAFANELDPSNGHPLYSFCGNLQVRQTV